MQRKGGKEKTSSCREHMLVKYFSGENFKNKDESQNLGVCQEKKMKIREKIKF